MYKYEVLVYWSQEDERYIAEVPELSGCVADGVDPLDAVRNSQVIIGEWLETSKLLNRDIPAPKGKLMYA